MRVKVNVECTPEEARRFMGLPDVTPVNEQFVERMGEAISGAGTLEQAEKIIREMSPFGEMGVNMFKQFATMAGSAASSTSGKSGKK